MNVPVQAYETAADLVLETFIADAAARAKRYAAAGHQSDWEAMMALTTKLKALRSPGVVARLEAERLARAKTGASSSSDSIGAKT